MAKAALISIVDDDQSVREATKSFVQSLGYTVATFASAEEYLASDLVRNTSCLISDVKMPGMSGMDLLDRLVASGQRIPVIFVTAFPQQWIRTRALASGAIGFLSKPFNDKSLIACLHRAIKGCGSGPLEQ